MFSYAWEVGRETWVWRRRLWGWEEEKLGELQTLLFSSAMQVDLQICGVWQPDPDTGYSVCGAYQLLTS
jgi:hypothetical protein